MQVRMKIPAMGFLLILPVHQMFPFGLNYDTLYWSGGNGYFIDPNLEVPVYVPGQGEIGPVVLTMVCFQDLL